MNPNDPNVVMLEIVASRLGDALQSAEVIVLPSGTSIRLISAPMFLATKLEAFAG